MISSGSLEKKWFGRAKLEIQLTLPSGGLHLDLGWRKIEVRHPGGQMD